MDIRNRDKATKKLGAREPTGHLAHFELIFKLAIGFQNTNLFFIMNHKLANGPQTKFQVDLCTN